MIYMITSESINDLPRELQTMIFNRIDYHTLIKIKCINPALSFLISRYFEGIVYRVKKILNVDNLLNDEIVERIYHLNNYRNSSLSNIHQDNLSMGKLINGKWNCILINYLNGPWSNDLETDPEDRYIFFCDYKEYWYMNGVHHREHDRPAFIVNGKNDLLCKIWYNNGKMGKKINRYSIFYLLSSNILPYTN